MGTFQLIKPDPECSCTCRGDRCVHNHRQLSWTAVRSYRVDDFEKKETLATIKLGYTVSAA
jgi:hypothetical protein